jgi:hypothetical protein
MTAIIPQRFVQPLVERIRIFFHFARFATPLDVWHQRQYSAVDSHMNVPAEWRVPHSAE